jgi:hypothetical protein
MTIYGLLQGWLYLLPVSVDVLSIDPAGRWFQAERTSESRVRNLRSLLITTVSQFRKHSASLVPPVDEHGLLITGGDS